MSPKQQLRRHLRQEREEAHRILHVIEDAAGEHHVPTAGIPLHERHTVTQPKPHGVKTENLLDAQTLEERPRVGFDGHDLCSPGPLEHVGVAALERSDLEDSLPAHATRLCDGPGHAIVFKKRRPAGLRLETGDFRCTMNPIQANEAFNRVAGTITSDEAVEMAGVLKGVLLESWKFDFVTDENHSVGGKIDENLTEEQVIGLNREFFNERCLAALLKTTVLFKNGRVRTSYTLTGLASTQ